MCARCNRRLAYRVCCVLSVLLPEVINGSRTMEGSDKIPPRFDENSDDYDQWVKDLELWSNFTSIKKDKQAIAVHLQLKGRARQATSKIPTADMKSEKGMEKILEALNRVFGQDENWKCFNTYLAFESYHRDKDCSIDEYLSEFDMRIYKLEACKVKLPDAVIACRLLKSCSLSDMHFQLALSTVPNMTFEDMRCTLKKLFVENKICDKFTASNMACSRVEFSYEDVMYGE